MFIDSHCHLDFESLKPRLGEISDAMTRGQVSHALCISVEMSTLPQVLEVAGTQPNWYATVGVHPDYENTLEPDEAMLLEWAKHPKVVGIGETGLDYYRLTGDLEWQRNRFRTHIRAARQAGLPLIIHTRHAAEDTLAIMKEEKASEVGGVMHCFTESRAVAEAAIEMGFYISFSGIVTFKNALALKELARVLPLEKMLIETDSPYLAPTPHRGKVNEPAFVVYVAEEIARLRGVTREEVGLQTSRNFLKLFRIKDEVLS
jgi:TatD DNase family protein